MKFLLAAILILLNVQVQAQVVEKQEARKEIVKLEKLRKEIKSLIEEKKRLLEKIREEREALRKEKEELIKLQKRMESERYKKLAKVFEKMDPELAGQKISKLSNPKEAAYIIYNMKERKAGEVLNYVDPEMVNKIVKILATVKTKEKK